MPSPTVKIALQDRKLADRLTELLGRHSLQVEQVPRTALHLDATDAADVVVIRRGDVDPGALSERDEVEGQPEVIVLSEDDDPHDRARLVAAGAAQVVHEGLDVQALGEIVSAIADGEGGIDGPAAGGHPSEARLADFASTDPQMQAFLSVVERVAGTDATLLVTGETGVGKERLAQAIHAEGPRADKPFVAVHCGALPEQLLEAELFGHEKGSFTGAERRHRGRFEQADGGTIFLDEIGEMPLHLQVKLLTVLQDRQIRRIGGERDFRVDVRVIAATNRDLSAAVAEGEFREDLFYRLNVVPLELPPLRARKGDLPVLVGRFIRHFREVLGERKQSVPDGVSEAAMHALLAHDWPGNVRELANVIERAMLLARGRLIRVDDLLSPIGHLEPTAAIDAAPGANGPLGLGDLPDEWLDSPLAAVRQRVHDHFERRYLIGLLERHGGAIGHTAKSAGISPRSLYDKMRRHDLHKEDFRHART
jgi:DNA-binding NtrC family response regulator